MNRAKAVSRQAECERNEAIQAKNLAIKNTIKQLVVEGLWKG